MRPLGVGINLQPNAVRELYDLGITEADLDRVGLPAREWALVGLNGNDIYSEPRGKLAGYNWPQYAVHRGQFHMLLHDKVVERIGPQAVKLGSRVAGYRKHRRRHRQRAGRARRRHDLGAARRAADRRRRHPLRGARADASRPAADPLGRRGDVARHHLGQADPHRLVLRRARHAPPPDGVLSDLASRPGDRPRDDQLDRRGHHGQQRGLEAERLVPAGADSRISSITSTTGSGTGSTCPALLRGADSAFENPMIDRDPVPTWRDGPVALIGDAAHPMYPTGSNGGSQAIVDTRILGACMVEHGVTPAALEAYDAKLCGPISQLVLRNRGAGPFGLLNMVDERCGGTFDNIDDVILRRRSAPRSWRATRPPRALPSRRSTRRRRRFAPGAQRAHGGYGVRRRGYRADAAGSPGLLHAVSASRAEALSFAPVIALFVPTG